MARIKTREALALREGFIDAVKSLDKAKQLILSPPILDDLEKAKSHLNSLIGELEYTIKKRAGALQLHKIEV